MDGWKALSSVEELDSIAEKSFSRPQLIFKHSTRCGISSAALDRLQDSHAALSEGIDLHYLDLLAYRPVSKSIAEKFDVFHQSPQVIVLHKGESIFSQTHFSIRPQDILEKISQI